MISIKMSQVFILFSLIFILGSRPSQMLATSAQFQKGDVFINTDTSTLHYDATGTLLETIDTGTTDATQCAFDSAGKLYITTPSSVISFSGPNGPHANSGVFGHGLQGEAQSILFDALGNVYVGVIGSAPFLYKFDGGGNSLDQFTLKTDLLGIDSVDLAADQKTLFYTSFSKRILRYDVNTHTQLPDFVSVLPGSYASSLRILPDASLLVANAEFILHLDSAGNELKRYDVSNINAWESLSLASDGKTFWTQSVGSTTYYQFDIATGKLLFSKDIGGEVEISSLCVFGEFTASTLDSDGDGFPDFVEKNGYDTVDRNGHTVHVNLPGADKDRKNVYVYIDWLELTGDHSHKPSQEAIDRVIQAFASAPVDCDGTGKNCKGISLYVQFGNRIVETTGASGNQELGAIQQSDGGYDWREFQTYKDISFPREFLPAYHYVIFGHTVVGRQGVSRGVEFGASDFAIGLGGWDTAHHLPRTTTDGWATVFMHELGHNLGLGHGGVILSADGKKRVRPDDTHYKPNYLSVMNYAFNGTPSGWLGSHSFGLRKRCGIFFFCNGNVDYSRFGADVLPDLVESRLNENNGLHSSDVVKDYSTYYYCPGDGGHNKPKSIEPIKQSVDWNCDHSIIISPIVQTADINQDKMMSTLTTVNEWPYLVYKGGAIGAFGAPIQLSEQTEIGEGDEFTVERLIENSDRDPLLISLVADQDTLKPGEIVTYTTRVASNTGADIAGIIISDTLPAGFTYQHGSTTGATTTDPIITGQTLVYPGPFTVVVNDILAISFKISSPDASGIYLSSAQASDTNTPLVGTGDTAQVIVGGQIHLPLVFRDYIATLSTATPVVPTPTSTSIANNIPTATSVSPTATNTPVPPTATSIPPTPTFTPIPNTPPVANNQNVTTSQNTAKNITLTATDADNDPLTYSVLSNPPHGTLSGTVPNLTYTPANGFSGSDSFMFKANDGKADSNIGTINITVTTPTSDTDGDGVPDATDSAPTNPCIPNVNALACATGDTDNDGTANGSDPAPTNPCVPNANAVACSTGDADGDGVPNGSDPAPINPCDPNPNVPACLQVTTVQLSTGSSHNCAIRSDDTLACWGKNNYNQASPPAGSFTQVAAGANHSCAIKHDGTVACWGDNSNGQLISPVGVFTKISAGAFHTCGIKGDGSLTCWGNDNDGQATPPAGLFTKISAGAFHTCGVKSDGSLACWGNDNDGQATPPTGQFKQSSAGNAHTCAIKSDNTVACWGDDTYGQATAPSGSFSQISAGNRHTCGIKSDGSLTCWGDNSKGQATPPTGIFTQVGTGDLHSCGLRNDGIVICWGDNSAGQIVPP